MRNLFTVPEMLQGVPAPTLLNLAYRSIGSYIRLYPNGHPAQVQSQLPRPEGRSLRSNPKS